MLYQNFVPGMKVKHKSRGEGYIVRLLSPVEITRRASGVQQCVFSRIETDIEGYYVFDNELKLLELPKDFKKVEQSNNYIRR